MIDPGNSEESVALEMSSSGIGMFGRDGVTEGGGVRVSSNMEWSSGESMDSCWSDVTIRDGKCPPFDEFVGKLRSELLLICCRFICCC